MFALRLQAVEIHERVSSTAAREPFFFNISLIVGREDGLEER